MKYQWKDFSKPDKLNFLKTNNMSQISQEVIQKVRDRADIVEIIGETITLHKKGLNHIGICPFHSDTAPSLTVSAQKGIYTCFACGATGDAINYIKESERISFVESIKYLAKKYHIELPEIKQTSEEITRQKQRDSVFIVLDEVQKQFSSNLTTSESATEYMKNVRQISDEICELYKIGYALPDNQLMREFPTRGYSFDLLLASGMAGISEEKKFQYDTFRSRITFPYLDLHGRAIGFTGRHTDWKKGDPFAKYSNTGDTVAFNKGNVLFGLYQAKQEIAKSN